jgi:CRISPR/Cas system-associated exonuclease Cas4 (RecB family)
MKNVVFISEISYSIICLRKAFFNSYYRPRFPETKESLQGKELHKSLCDDPVFKNNAEFEVECQYELNAWKLRGRADAVTADAVYEFKFISSSRFDSPSPIISAYKMQTAAYCRLLKKRNGYLVLVDRETRESKKIPVKVDFFWGIFLKHASNLIEHLRIGRIPEKDSPRFPFACKYCAWNIICEKLQSFQSGARCRA